MERTALKRCRAEIEHGVLGELRTFCGQPRTAKGEQIEYIKKGGMRGGTDTWYLIHPQPSHELGRWELLFQFTISSRT